MNWMKRQKMIGYLFIFPSVLGVFIFFFLPLLFSLGLAFTDWQGPAGVGTKFIGMTNFIELFADPIFKSALINTLIYLLHVPVSVVLAFLVAIVLNKLVYMKNILRAMFFLP